MRIAECGFTDASGKSHPAEVRTIRNPQSEIRNLITQPPLTDTNRHPLTRDPDFKPITYPQKTQYIEELRQDADFLPDSTNSYRTAVTQFVADHNHGVDPFSSPYRAFLEKMIQIATSRSGQIIADDWNFEARALNAKLGKPPSDKVKAAQDKAEQKKKIKN